MTPRHSTPRGLLGSVQQAVREVVQLVRLPRLEVTVGLPAGHRTPVPGCAEAVSGAIAVHATALGIPLEPVVTIVPATGGGERAATFAVAGCPVPVPADVTEALAARSLDGVWPRPADPRWPYALATVTQVLVEQDPRVLVAAAQRTAVVRRARDAGIADYDDVFLAAALRYVIGQGVGVRELGPLVAALNRHDDVIQTAGELAEVAIDVLRPASIEIRLRASTLREVTTRGGGADSFGAMRRRLFTSLGVTFPDIDVVVGEVPEGACALRLNQVTLQPRRLPDGATVADLVAFVERRLRRYASWFVSASEVRNTVEEVRLALPELVGIVQERHSYPRLAMLARALVEERVPVRNSARLMVLLLDTPATSTGADLVCLAEPARDTTTETNRAQCPRQLVSYARQQINEEAARLAPGVVTVPAVRLPADLDATLSDARAWDGIVPDDLPGPAMSRLVALAERESRRPGHTLVTATQQSRAAARSILGGRFPELCVVAAEEYPPAYRIVDVADS